MKLINKFFLGLCAVSLLAIVSCDKNDDDGPSKPSDSGIFAGKMTDTEIGGESDWVATSTKAEHDTISGELRITAKNAGGDVIMILLPSTELKMHDLFQNTSGEATYQSATLTGAATTRTNDVSGPKVSKIQITDNGDTDGKIRGKIHVIHWYTVGPEIDDDVRIRVFNTPEEFEISLTRGANMSGSGQANITAKIDGAAFNPTVVTPFGFMLMATDLSQTITIQLPNNAAVGEHDFESSFSNYNVTYMAGTNAYNMQGTITLIDFNSIAGTATGTFEATATPGGGGDSISITAGTFRF